MRTVLVERIPLRAWRDRLALSQRELAERAGMSPTTIARIELGGPVRPTTRQKLAAALGITPAELLDGPPARPGLREGQ
jgi:transcriptional regulator with XRE-family HTH domain